VIEASLQRIEQKLAILERRFGDLSAPLRNAFSYRNSDPQSALTKCRIVLEKLLHDIHQREFGTTSSVAMVGQLLSNKELRNRLPRRTLAKMKIILEQANLGAHGDQVSSDDVEMTLLNIFEVLDWYHDTYRQNLTTTSAGFQIGRELIASFSARLKYPLRKEIASVKIAKTATDVYLQVSLCHRDVHPHFPWAGDSREVTNRYNLAQVLWATDGEPAIDPSDPIEKNESQALALCDEEVFWVLDSNLFTEEISDAILRQLVTKSASYEGSEIKR
jgi:hypothetical protein